MNSDIENLITTQAAELTTYADELRRAALSPETIRRYRDSWNLYTTWCAERDLTPLTNDARQLAAWLHGRWDLRPSTLRNDANAARLELQRAGLKDPMAEPLVDRLLNAHSRHHGVAPLPENVVAAFTSAELKQLITAPIGTRGMVNQDHVDRGIATVILLSNNIPMRQIARIPTDAATNGETHIRLALPAVRAPGRSVSTRVRQVVRFWLSRWGSPRVC